MIIIGTVHIDLQGPRTLERLLEQLAPQSISVEAPCNLPLLGADWQQQLFGELDGLFADTGSWSHRPEFLGMPKTQQFQDLFRQCCATHAYEEMVPAAYAERRGIPIYCVDEPMTTLETPRQAASRLYRKCLRPHLRGVDVADSVALHNMIAAATDYVYTNCIDGMRSGTPLDIKEINVRDEHMGRLIREHRPEIHIGGCVHTHCLAGRGYLPLGDRLADSTTKKILLRDVYAGA